MEYICFSLFYFLVAIQLSLDFLSVFKRFAREYACEFITVEDTLISGAKLIQMRGIEICFK
jgi:hypothetical protein